MNDQPAGNGCRQYCENWNPVAAPPLGTSQGSTGVQNVLGQSFRCGVSKCTRWQQLDCHDCLGPHRPLARGTPAPPGAPTCRLKPIESLGRSTVCTEEGPWSLPASCRSPPQLGKLKRPDQSTNDWPASTDQLSLFFHCIACYWFAPPLHFCQSREGQAPDARRQSSLPCHFNLLRTPYSVPLVILTGLHPPSPPPPTTGRTHSPTATVILPTPSTFRSASRQLLDSVS